MAFCSPVTPEAYGCVASVGCPGAAIRLPGNGLAKAQGLYQFSLVLVFAAHVTPGLVRSEVPPALKGSPIRIARAPPPAAVLISGLTVNGVPVCATKVRLVDHPPTARSVSRPLFKYALPEPKGS